MTATTKPPTRERRPHNRPVRFSFMETLGFSNPSSTWSESPAQLQPRARGRHEAAEPAPTTVADWEPEDFGNRLTGSNFRWSLLIVTILVVGGLAGIAYWLYQRPAAEIEASRETLVGDAAALREALPILENFNQSLIVGADTESADLFAVDAAARALFDASGDIPDTDTVARTAAASASASALDAVRLAGDANSYQLAVTPILVAPELETDSNVIDLDEAARSFGAWQLHFNEVRTALPDSTLSTTTSQLDILSGDLPNFLSRYMDALRGDDQEEAEAVIRDLASRLSGIEQQMTDSLSDVRDRVTERISETTRALDRVLDN